MSTGTNPLRGRLGAFLADRLGVPVDVSDLRPLAGGASRAAYAVDVDIPCGVEAGHYAAVLRLDLGGDIYADALSRSQEFEVLSVAREHDVMVPQVLWNAAGSTALERPFFVMERVDGETIGAKIVRSPHLAEARTHLPRQMGEQLARIHAIPADRVPFVRRPEPEVSTSTAVLSRTRAELERAGGDHPGIELGLRWLAEHAPEDTTSTVVHGDFRLGNLVVDGDGLRSILDWEFAGVGDPYEDLAWPFVRDWRFGHDEHRFAGLSDGEDFLLAYEETRGAQVDRKRLRYWEAVGNLRWAVGCLTQALRHTSGAEPSVELAVLGRRSAEMQLEMLRVIEEIA